VEIEKIIAVGSGFHFIITRAEATSKVLKMSRYKSRNEQNLNLKFSKTPRNRELQKTTHSAFNCSMGTDIEEPGG